MDEDEEDEEETADEEMEDVRETLLPRLSLSLDVFLFINHACLGRRRRRRRRRG